MNSNNTVFLSKNVSTHIKGIAIFIIILHHMSITHLINFQHLNYQILVNLNPPKFKLTMIYSKIKNKQRSTIKNKY